MNCPNCGSPIADNSNFCKGCGDPVMPAAPQPPIEQSYQPPIQQSYQAPVYYQDPTPQPPKKSNTGLIIGAVVAVAVCVVIFCILGFVKPGFLLDKEETTTTSASDSAESTTNGGSSNNSNSSNNNNNNTPTKPSVDLQAAEDAADEYLNCLAKYDIVDLCNREILMWSDIETAVEKALIDAIAKETGYTMGIDELYSLLSQESGISITDAEDYIDIAVGQNSSSYDSITYTIKSSKEISKSEADKYISKTKTSIDSFSEFGLDSDNCPWDELESFVQVNCTVSNSTNVSENTVIILGFIDNEWVVVHMDDGTPSIYLSSLAFLSGMTSY